MEKRKIITMLIITVMVFSLVCSACGKQESNTIIETSIVESSYSIKECGEFYEGFAPVLYANTNDSDDVIFAVIDTQGSCVLSSKDGFRDSDGNEYRPTYCEKGGYKFTDTYVKPVYSEGKICLPTRDSNNDLVFCLIDSTGTVVYKINVTEKYMTASNFRLIYLGNCCWNLYSPNSVSLFICGRNGGEYDFDEESDDIECKELIDGYVLTRTHIADFYTNDYSYEVYNYEGKKTNVSLSQEELENIDKTDIEDLGHHVMMWMESSESSFSNEWHFYNIEKNKEWVLNPVENEYKMDVISDVYNENGDLIISASNYDDRKLFAYAFDTEGNKKTLGELDDFVGYIFCNYDTRIVNGSKGAVTYDDENLEYGYFDFEKEKFYPITRAYPGKKANTILAFNKSLMAIRMEGSDGENYSALIDMECNEVTPPKQNVDARSIGPWLFYDGIIYDETAKDVFKEWGITDVLPSEVEGYSDGYFNCKTNYLDKENKTLLLSKTVDPSFFRR